MICRAVHHLQDHCIVVDAVLDRDAKPGDRFQDPRGNVWTVRAFEEDTRVRDRKGDRAGMALEEHHRQHLTGQEGPRKGDLLVWLPQA
jgi:hypothetical protein